MLSKICCFNSDFCKCEFLGLTRSKNIKLGYIFIILLAYGILQLLDSLVEDTSAARDSFACN